VQGNSEIRYGRPLGENEKGRVPTPDGLLAIIGEADSVKTHKEGTVEELDLDVIRGSVAPKARCIEAKLEALRWSLSSGYCEAIDGLINPL
jgi:hypothetical protein